MSRLLQSTVGMKILMAVTGLLLFGFVFVHMTGNLQIYLPADAAGVRALDTYAKFLDETAHGALKWGARVVLLAAIGLHIFSWQRLTALQAAARPEGYTQRVNRASTLASRTMKLTGPVILAFIIVHLLHFTVGWKTLLPAYEHGKVFANVVQGFRSPGMSVFYIVAQLALAPHLAHGGYSLLRSLGLESPERAELGRKIALALAIVITAANISVPVAVLTGFVGKDVPAVTTAAPTPGK
jgi:succinate dehydrogenase / fumarate reductase cytochrome b subunit